MDAKNSTVIPAVTSGENNIFSSTTNAIPEAGLEEKWYHPKCHYIESQLLEAELNFTGLYSSVTAAPARVQGKPTQIHSAGPGQSPAREISFAVPHTSLLALGPLPCSGAVHLASSQSCWDSAAQWDITHFKQPRKLRFHLICCSQATRFLR